LVTDGKPAPTFTLPSDTGEDVSLESFRGSPVVL
jgi:peroxiredoxin